jgi:3-isopropylmalate/(R)-2-methylmalate dehydratase small subunit
VDLEKQKVQLADGTQLKFEVDSFRKHALLNGFDDIGLTLEKSDVIKQYEVRRASEAPWLFS